MVCGRSSRSYSARPRPSITRRHPRAIPVRWPSDFRSAGRGGLPTLASRGGREPKSKVEVGRWRGGDMPKRIQLSRKKGWRLPPGAVVVARPTRWGNPFKAAAPDAKSRSIVVARYRKWLSSAAGKSIRLAARECLAGRDLACWCPLDGPCHADALIKVANERE